MSANEIRNNKYTSRLKKKSRLLKIVSENWHSWFAVSGERAPCVKERKRGKGIKWQCQSLWKAGTDWKEFKPALWAWSAPKGIRKCWFPAGKIPATLFRIGIMPKGKRLLQVCWQSRESSGWAWKYPPYTHRKPCVLVLYSSSPCSSCSCSFIHLTQSPPASGSSHTHQNKVLLRLSSLSAAPLVCVIEDFWISCQCGRCQRFS